MDENINSTEKNSLSELEDLKIKHELLQIKKLDLEIASLCKPTFYRLYVPEILKWIPAILIAGVSLFITYKTGLFQTKEDKIKIQQDLLSLNEQKQSIKDTMTIRN